MMKHCNQAANPLQGFGSAAAKCTGMRPSPQVTEGGAPQGAGGAGCAAPENVIIAMWIMLVDCVYLKTLDP